MEEQNHETKHIYDSSPGSGHGCHSAYGLRKQACPRAVIRTGFNRADCPPEESAVESEAPTSAESSGEDNESTSADKVTLKILYFYSKNTESDKVASSIVKAFEDANPNINVELSDFQSEYAHGNFISIAITESYPVDIIWFGKDWVHLLDVSSDNLMIDLTPYLENDGIDISVYGDAAKRLYREENESHPAIQAMLPTSGGESVGICGELLSSNQEETAWEFIKFACGEEAAEIYAQNGVTPEEENGN